MATLHYRICRQAPSRPIKPFFWRAPSTPKFPAFTKPEKSRAAFIWAGAHEAIAACGGVFLTAGYDVIAPFIREQAARVAWGEPIIEAARAYLGSALGYMKGRDGNVHRGLPAEGYMAPISHLGSSVAFVNGCLSPNGWTASFRAP